MVRLVPIRSLMDMSQSEKLAFKLRPGSVRQQLSTPIDWTPQGQSTFKTFEQDDPRGYIEPIEDRTTVPLHFGHSHSTLDLLLRKRQEAPLPKTETPAMP